jgi:hypothetical protein
MSGTVSPVSDIPGPDMFPEPRKPRLGIGLGDRRGSRRTAVSVRYDRIHGQAFHAGLHCVVRLCPKHEGRGLADGSDLIGT